MKSRATLKDVGCLVLRQRSTVMRAALGAGWVAEWITICSMAQKARTGKPTVAISYRMIVVVMGIVETQSIARI